MHDGFYEAAEPGLQVLRVRSHGNNLVVSILEKVRLCAEGASLGRTVKKLGGLARYVTAGTMRQRN